MSRKIGFFAKSFPGRVRLDRREKPKNSDLESISYDKVESLGTAGNAIRHAATTTSASEDTVADAADAQQPSSNLERIQSNHNASSSSSPIGDKGAFIAEHPGGDGAGPFTNIRNVSSARLLKFQKCLSQPVVDLDQLRELAWSGVPATLRPVVWKLLLGYLPPNRSRQETVLARKRKEYRDMVPEYYDVANSERTDDEMGALRQVAVDVPRTAPGVPFFHQQRVQKVLERILYIWGLRHPASGYVQGINDLLTPFLAIFFSEHCSGAMDGWTIDQLGDDMLYDVEADSYWCLCKLLDGIQDHYTYAQPGIQRTVFQMKELVRRIDDSVALHLDDEGVEFLQFSFRWVNCLLVREVPFELAPRLWDTYLAEGPRLKEFLIYVLAAFLMTWKEVVKKLDFQEVIMYLQKVPTAAWTDRELESVLSQAFLWRASFDEAKSHFNG